MSSKTTKQSNLFSFFSKKPKPPKSSSSSSASTSIAATTITSSPKAATTAAAAAAVAASSTPKNSSISVVSQPSLSPAAAATATAVAAITTSIASSKWKQVEVGSHISVYWPDDDQYYAAQVSKQRQKSSHFFLKYDDGTSEWIDLSTEQFKLLLKQQQQPSTKKRRHIAQEEEDESDEEEHEEDDEDEDEDVVVRRPAKKKAKTTVSTATHLQVTAHRPKNITPPPSSSSSITTTAALRQFANTVSPNTQDSAIKKPQKSSSPEISTVSTTSTTSTSTASSTLNNINKPLKYERTKGAVNPRGSHVHNHLPFLQNPKDQQGRTKDDPNYDPRTLQMGSREIAQWDSRCGKMTNGVQQWWDLKKQYFDTVLLFKTGKFYELFHMDADVGVEVLGFQYMKGHVAHAGFPEVKYGEKADTLVRAGYKVVRVEQTETPDMLKERQHRAPKGKKPKVINREVCSILTLGTRTFCSIDDESAFEKTENNGGCGPLLAIREVLLDNSNDPMPMDDTRPSTTENDQDTVRPVCEYGITMVDAVRGTVTIGQFADDILRSRMNTLLMSFNPSEIVLQGGEHGASPTLQSLVRSYQTTTRTNCRIETIQSTESFPQSTALDPNHRRLLERAPFVKPWDDQVTLDELHRRAYYPRGSKNDTIKSISRWPQVLQAAVKGQATLCLSSFGAALFYLQRSLIDHEILSMGIVKAYEPPMSSCITSSQEASTTTMNDVLQSQRQEEQQQQFQVLEDNPLHDIPQISNAEDQIKNMALDGTTLHNLEILTNAVDQKVAGSLWSKINHTKTPHGARLLRAWLLRPLFRKTDIERRQDAVQELAQGAGAVACKEARKHVLGKIPDLDRLVSRVHSMSGTGASIPEDQDGSFHPNERAVLFESVKNVKRKCEDFSKLLNGLRTTCQIPELFADLNLENDGLLRKIVKIQGDGGCFPNMVEELDWYFDNFDCEKASKGMFEPARGVDQTYDDACDTIERIKAELEDYKQHMCDQLKPRHEAKSTWKYINVGPDSKDKYLIELKASVQVPDDFICKGKRGSGHKQIIKYRTRFVEELVGELEQTLEVQAVRKAKGMQLIFAKFDSQRSMWAAAAQATGLLDALGSLAKTSESPGFCRPKILDCPPNQEPTINIVQGRHPCVETSFHSTDFVPNDLSLGRASQEDSSRLLLLSGPNMGGKSTLLRQTCLISILAQIGSNVPAEACELTPIDCIYTRLGASDRILLGQSTFFVELAETAAALRGATRRSLVIMDELGRGTSTFDGTAIAGATVKHLIDRSQCLSLFATHYHSLLDEWKDEPKVRLGHMQCHVEENTEDGSANDSSITFLYTLGPGTCPKSFGINVARLASLPEEVLAHAKRVSQEYEDEMTEAHRQRSAESAALYKEKIMAAIQAGQWEELERLWQELKK